MVSWFCVDIFICNMDVIYWMALLTKHIKCYTLLQNDMYRHYYNNMFNTSPGTKMGPILLTIL